MPDAYNPYLPDKGQQLAALLMSMGQGITASDMTGRGVLPGLGLGAGIYGASQAQAMQHAQDWQQQQEARAFRDRQIGLQEAELADKRGERDRLRMGANAWAAANGGIPGLRAPEPTAMMGPGAFNRAIAGVETAGQADPYTAIGPDTGRGRAHGKYQVMDFNIGPWTQEVLGKAMTPQEFLANPQAQEAVFNTKFNQAVQKYGSPQDAASWWFSGKPLAGNTSGPDVLGTTVAGYVNKFNRGLYGNQQASYDDGSVTPVAAPVQAARVPGAPPAAVAPGGAPPSGAPAAPALPTLEEPPRPTQLPAEMARYLSQQVISGGMTVPQAEAEKQRILGEMWSAQRQSAQTRYQQQVDLYKHQRGLETDGEWVRGADGVERFVPKSQRPAGMQRFDKPKDAGTETGDVEILGKADPSSREYAAAYNRLSQKWHDIGGGQKIRADMTAYAKPTFVEPNAAAPPKPEGERSYTETQNKDHTYATRLDMAIPEFVKLLKDDKGNFSMANVPRNSQWVAANSAYYPESQVSPKVKEFRRLAADISTALLRRESGASIGKHEFTTEDYKFIPLAGDTPEIVAKKMAALHNAARTFAEGTGRDKYSYKNLWPSDGAAASPPPPSAPIKIDMGGNRR